MVVDDAPVSLASSSPFMVIFCMFSPTATMSTKQTTTRDQTRQVSKGSIFNYTTSFILTWRVSKFNQYINITHMHIYITYTYIYTIYIPYTYIYTIYILIYISDRVVIHTYMHST